MSTLVQIGTAPVHHLSDSMGKMLLVFFAAVTKEPITYEGATVHPKPLVVSPLIFRGFTCPTGCGACCGRSTLDYIPGEPRPEEASERVVVVNGREVKMYSDLQTDHNSYFCRHLDTDARCNTYNTRPFSCDFALLNVNEYKTHYLLSCRKFGRHHLWKRIDDGRGTMCDMLPITDESIAATRRRLLRLQLWTDYFKINSRMQEINYWAAQDPYTSTHLRLG